MLVVQECALLKIEDILPCFPEFVTIDDFQVGASVFAAALRWIIFFGGVQTGCHALMSLQDALCSSLEQYSRDIETLKLEMDQATKSAASIRGDLAELKNKSVSFTNPSLSCALYLPHGILLLSCCAVIHGNDVAYLSCVVFLLFLAVFLSFNPM
jgi:hypothetical protein